jgi:hypothetical protein
MYRILCVVAILLGNAAGAERQSAFQAFQSVPVTEGARLARIGACEGSPVPERWHFIVHDPALEGGLWDYVVADGRVVARNGVSQFAREVHPEDVLPPGSVQLDSDRVASVAARYAAANDLEVVSMNYELRKEPVDAQPVWKVTCLDAQGGSVGWLIFDATDGSVIARGGGFSQRPALPSVNGEPLYDPTDDDRGVGGFQRRPSADARGNDALPATPRPERTEVRRAEPVYPAHRRIVIDPFRAVRDLLPF